MCHLFTKQIYTNELKEQKLKIQRQSKTFSPHSSTIEEDIQEEQGAAAALPMLKKKKKKRKSLCAGPQNRQQPE